MHLQAAGVACHENIEGCQWNEQAVMSHVAAQTKDLDVAYTRRIEAREAVRAEADAASVQAALCRVFPMPCRSRYVALSLLPQKPLLERVVFLLHFAVDSYCCQAS